jgi:hypothetical protein
LLNIVSGDGVGDEGVRNLLTPNRDFERLGQQLSLVVVYGMALQRDGYAEHVQAGGRWGRLAWLQREAQEGDELQSHTGGLMGAAGEVYPEEIVDVPCCRKKENLLQEESESASQSIPRVYCRDSSEGHGELCASPDVS